MGSSTTACEAGPSNPSTPTYIKTAYGKARRVSTETFLDTYAPPLPPSVDIDKLLDTRDIVCKNGRMWGYEHKRPSDMTPKYAFSYLSRCVSRLAASSASYGPRHSFLNNPDRKWDAKEAASDALPDAYILLASEEKDEEPPKKRARKAKVCKF